MMNYYSQGGGRPRERKRETMYDGIYDTICLMFQAVTGLS